MELSWSGKALIVTLLFRLLFGGYLIGTDLYSYHDPESAFTVLLIYGVIGVLAALFITGRKYGLAGIIALDVVFIITQFVFTILALGQTVNAGLHDPMTNWWTALLMCLFSLLMLAFAIKTYTESGPSSRVLRAPAAA